MMVKFYEELDLALKNVLKRRPWWSIEVLVLRAVDK